MAGFLYTPDKLRSAPPHPRQIQILYVDNLRVSTKMHLQIHSITHAAQNKNFCPDSIPFKNTFQKTFSHLERRSLKINQV